MNVRLHPRLYVDVGPDRAREWRSTLMDMAMDARGAGAEDVTLTLDRRDCGGVDLHVERAGELTTLEAPYKLLRRHFREYRGIIEQLARSTRGAYGARDLETLDYAKKLAHDDAAETLAGLLAGVLEIQHVMARRLFTLIFLVSSELPEDLVTRHRHR